jgi:DNA modification methylase
MMKRVIKLGRAPSAQLPPGEEDVTFSEELVEVLLAEFTQPGDLVLDPFAGFGTTLVVAERMGRRALGVELLPERVAFIRTRLMNRDAVVEGDALHLAGLNLPAVDFVMTSPPYMALADHPQNPLTAYRTLDGDYTAYIRQLGLIFESVGRLLKPGGHVVINIANLRSGAVLTPLARDISDALSSVMTLEQEALVESVVADPTTEGNYCYVFRHGRTIG